MNKLQLARQAQGMRQADLARRVGVARPTLALIETGRRRPSAAVAAKLAEVLDVDPTWLFSEEVAGNESRVDERD